MSGPVGAGSPAGVLVAIPAHDEEDLLAGCLEQVLAALHHARSAGSIARAVVAVTAHRCTDRTAAVAREVLTRATLSTGLAVGWHVLEDEGSATIAEVRRAAVEAGARSLEDTAGAGDHGIWLFNTDADSLVPPEWITHTLRIAARERAVAVAGLVEVTGWEPPPSVLWAYDTLVARGLHGSGHDHAYGANLAVRLDAYRAVGGFTPRRHGEDHELLRRLRGAGHRVATPLSPRVSTSGRENPRCPDGLGALLRRLGEASGTAPA
ncbi:glycosyltransferase [Citricoccus nitrophenolicus]|uniref:Glycosyltransferase n=1 Tax=Citricoccus nitrophenolicus TaxID=863575 RepID=A0ABV0IJR3_9MICC